MNVGDSENNKTALHYAAEHRNVQVTAILLQAGAGTGLCILILISSLYDPGLLLEIWGGRAKLGSTEGGIILW